MPKRLIDDSLLTSPSLAACSPRAQDAFPRFILLADDFGCFEAFPRVLVAKGWPYRSDVSEADAWGWIEEYVAAGMACLWTEKERRWCYLTGWHGPHGQKVRAEYDPNAPKGTPGRHGSKRRTPVPPADLVAAVLAGERRVHDGKPPGCDREDTDESLNDSVPAREMTVSRQSPATVPPFPGPAVPVAVAVPVARSPSMARLVSPFPEGQDPHPGISAVLAGLFDRGLDASPPSDKQAARVEAAIQVVGVDVAVQRIALRLEGGGEKPLTYHVDAIRGERAPRRTTGDLGCDLAPWHQRLTREEVEAFLRERHDLAPEMDEAPLAAVGPERELAPLIDKYRAITEGRA